MSYFDDVGKFHRKFELPCYEDGGAPQLLSEDVYRFRLKFMVEELKEFVAAHRDDDLEKSVDALADLIYVALGTAHFMRMPFDWIWNEVHRANMTKVRAIGADDPLSTRKHRFDVVKPPDFRPPNHGPLIYKARRIAHGEE